MDSYLIRTEQLTKKFGKLKAVNGIDLKVPEGKIYGFLGPNGAGKSTTIRMLLGLIKPTAGNAFLFNKSIKDHRMEILSQVGSMVETPSYYGHLTAQENMEIVRRIREVGKKEVDRVLEIVNLIKVRDRKVKNFSMGMKQRLGIAQALLGDPGLLVLDEPTNGLDPSGIHEIRVLIKSLPQKMGVTILVSSHILSEIELMANHLGIIKEGNLIFQGTLDQLRSKSKSIIKINAQPRDSVKKYIIDRGYDYQDGEEGLLLKAKDLNPARITRELVMADFDVSHISREESTLEEIFLNLTGEEEE